MTSRTINSTKSPRDMIQTKQGAKNTLKIGYFYEPNMY